jgi:hypothetical protein
MQYYRECADENKKNIKQEGSKNSTSRNETNWKKENRVSKRGNKIKIKTQKYSSTEGVNDSNSK